MPEPRVPAWFDEDSHQDFVRYYNDPRAKLLLFVGSGISRDAGLPDWEHLLRQIPVVADPSLAIRADAQFESLIKAKKFAKAGSRLAKQFGKHGGRQAKAWRASLEKILLPDGKAPEITELHRLVINLKWEALVTTNYDTLLEEALRERGTPFEVSHPLKRDFQRVPSASIGTVIKIHGDIADPESELLLTEEGYKDFYESASQTALHFRGALEVLFRSATVILFLGYSHDDPYLRELISSLSFPRDTLRPAFVLAPLPFEQERLQFQEKSKDLLIHSGITVIPYRNEDNTHREVREFLEYLQNQRGFARHYGVVKSVRQPTVVLLYTGGTISATERDEETEALGLPEISSRFDPVLARRAEDILASYGKYYYSDLNPNFDLQWEVLSPESQILSENASPDHWNNILMKLDDIIFKYFIGPTLVDQAGSRIQDSRLREVFLKEASDFKETTGEEMSERQFIDSFKGRYVAGVIIQHGTDTLAYTAAALNFAVEDLPCPVVLTGANQPPDNSRIVENEPEFWESDTWKNMATSLYFLQCIGHRYTEVFVCFSDTVSHGPNLRKTPLEMFPVRRTAVRRHRVEPFAFRNYSLRRQYVFRCIEGVFCNNLYPLFLRKRGPGSDGGFDPYSYGRIVKNNEKFKHFRENPFVRGVVSVPKVTKFCAGVAALKVHPSFPDIDIAGWTEKGKRAGVRAVVIEGYKSGTYPTKSSLPFAQFLLDLYNAGIPVVLVARYGIHPTSNLYETESVGGNAIPVVRLFGVIMETALPLVSFVVGNISRKDWKYRLKGARATEYRANLVRRRVSDFLLGRRNIVTLDLGDSTDQLALKAHADLLIDQEINNDHERRRANMDPISRVRFEPRDPERSKQWTSGRQENFLETDLLRGDFLWFLGELIRPLEKAGAAPDGFTVLADMGFDWGFHGVEGYYKDKGLRTDGVILVKRGEEMRAKIIQEADEIIASVLATLSGSGISHVSRVEAGGLKVNLVLGDEGSATSQFSFEVKVHKGADNPQHQVRYWIQPYTESEAQFFRALMIGGGADERRAELATRYGELARLSWQQLLNDVDWFLLGAMKGLACALASYLQFDELCAGLVDTQERRARIRIVRAATRLEVLPTEAAAFKVRTTYYAHKEGFPKRRMEVGSLRMEPSIR